MVITETRLENIANGYLDPDKLDSPFIITRTHNSLRRSTEGEGCWVYSFIWGRKFNREFEIDETLEIAPRTAKKLIKIYNMTIAHQTEDGQIYEMTGNPYRDFFRNKKRRAS